MRTWVAVVGCLSRRRLAASGRPAHKLISRGPEWAVGGVGSRGTAMAWLFGLKNGCKMETNCPGPGPSFTACEASPSSPPPLALFPHQSQTHMMSAKQEATGRIAAVDWLQCRSSGPNAVDLRGRVHRSSSPRAGVPCDHFLTQTQTSSELHSSCIRTAGIDASEIINDFMRGRLQPTGGGIPDPLHVQTTTSRPQRDHN